MDVLTLLRSQVGQWRGTYKLWLDPGKDPEVSETTLVVKPTANGSYFLIHYDWSFRDQSKAGIFLIGGKDKRAQATWGDSFHMEPMAMVCEGKLNGDGLILNGSYAAGDQQWGWRTELFIKDKNLVMRAYNIAPSGQEDIALEAVYQQHSE